MEFFNRIKNYFGFPSATNNHKDGIPSNNYHSGVIARDPHDGFPDEFEKFGFNIFTNPLEMHRYFERQMDEMMKNFGIFGGSSFFGSSLFEENGEPFFDENILKKDGFSQFPAIDDFHKDEPNLREHYLKPGFEQAKDNDYKKSDRDIDGKFDYDDLDSIYKKKLLPSRSHPQTSPRSFFFSHSRSSRTIRKPNGSIETHQTIKDQEGNVETIVTQKLGDKEYSVIKKKDKCGREEITENFVNMEESEKDIFLKGSSPRLKITDGRDRKPSWFPFDGFFK